MPSEGLPKFQRHQPVRAVGQESLANYLVTVHRTLNAAAVCGWVIPSPGGARSAAGTTLNGSRRCAVAIQYGRARVRAVLGPRQPADVAKVSGSGADHLADVGRVTA